MRLSTGCIVLGSLIFAVSAPSGSAGAELPGEIRNKLNQNECLKCGNYFVRVKFARDGKLHDVFVMSQGFTVGSKKLVWFFIHAPVATYRVEKETFVVEISNPHILWPDGSKSTSGGARFEWKLEQLGNAASPTMQELFLFMQMEQKLQRHQD